MERGKAKQLLDRMQVLIEDGQNVPFAAGKVLVNQEEILEIIEDLKTTIDIELKAYHEITDKRSKIIKEANEEAEEIIIEAEETASRIRMSKPNPIAVQRKVRNLNKQDKMALRTANEIYAASIIYTNEMLMEINETVRQTYNMISMETDRVLDSLRKKSEIIEQNKRELMDGLMEMKKQERYADILEISQLLANELYYEKNKAMEDDQPEGEEQPSVVQWEFDFDEKKEEDKIKVKASREPVKIPDVYEEREQAETVYQPVSDIKTDRKAQISEDRTPVPLEESVTDSTFGKPAQDAQKTRPEFRISGGGFRD